MPSQTRLATAAAPLGLVIALLATLAPTCSSTTGPGVKSFSKHSLIIPMDACYQNDAATSPTGCPGSGDVGNVLHAYGLAYQFIQNGLTVHWVIEPAKNSFTDVDLSIRFNAGNPVGKFSRATGTFATPPPNNTSSVISYRGGLFIVDGRELSNAMDLLSTSLSPTFDDVNVHVSNVAFSAPVARTMSGGWQAGSSVPPPVALLNITGADGKNSVATVKEYLVAAGLGGLPGTEGTAEGPHGTIYDTLAAPDFCGSPSRLVSNGYRVLWAPHWVAGTANPPGCTLDEIRTSIREFVQSGKDYFSECASIGSVEGDTNACDGVQHTSNTSNAGRIASTGGLRINQYGWDYQCKNNTSTPTSRVYYPEFVPFQFSNFGSPFMQIAEFSFAGQSGYIANYAPASGSAWTADTLHLVRSVDDAFDVFTVKPGSNGSGTTVYLGGHDYSGRDQPLQIAGARLVLNTLFNLGASCVTTNAACQTGQLGICGEGRMQCVDDAPACVQTQQPSSEICDLKDNDCNGLVDDGLVQTCYDGNAADLDRGICHGGTSTCSLGQWTSCQGQTLPTLEICNSVDDNCNGDTDDGLSDQPCYTGPVGSNDVGICRGGIQTCVGGEWGTCTGETRPITETCDNAQDDNCDGAADEGCGCITGAEQPCYSGPIGTAGVGNCSIGSQQCEAGTWGLCTGDVVPAGETCNGQDDNCDGDVDENGVCNACTGPQTRSCYDGDAATEGVGFCRAGSQACQNGGWGSCAGQVLPATEICNGVDDNCDDSVDEDALCAQGTVCTHGVCVPAECDPEGTACPEGFLCSDGQCAVGNCGAVTCPAGQTCQGEVCVDPCATVLCAQGSICAGGHCTGGGCYATACPVSQFCSLGTCVQDPCATVECPHGTFCRQGYCIQACSFVTCAAGEKCGSDGFCVTDPCSGVTTCGSDETCIEGTCQVDECIGLSCGNGLVCLNGRCEDDPCNAVHCPQGSCVDGQCWITVADIPDAGSPRSDAASGLSSSSGGSGGAQSSGEGGTPSSGAGADDGMLRPSCGCDAPGASPPALSTLWALLLACVRKRKARWVPCRLLAWPKPKETLRILALPNTWTLSACLLLMVMACTTSWPVEGPNGETRPGQLEPCDVDQDCAVGQVCISQGCQQGAASSSTSGGPVCEQCGGLECVNILEDKQHCGRCNNSCGSMDQCVLGYCGPASPVAPALLGVDPSSGAVGQVLALLVTGQRFLDGAKVLVTGTDGVQELSATVDSGARIRLTLDLTSGVPGRISLRVLNPDRTLSNAAAFDVTASTPHIESMSPYVGTRGDVVEVQMTGTGFNTTSRCKASGAGFPEQGLATVVESSTALHCTFDLGVVQPGVYDVWVANSGGLVSNTREFTVQSAVPSLASLSPLSGRPGAQLSLTATGEHFDASSTLRFDGRVLATTYISSTQLFASPLSLVDVVPGSYPVDVVNNGIHASNALLFAVTSDAPQILTVSPENGLQGAAVTLTVNGRGFDSGSIVHVFSPGGVHLELVTAFVDVSQVMATYDLSSAEVGNHLVEVINPGGLASNVVPFAVESSLAVISSISPAGGAQGTAVDIQLRGSNFLEGLQVRMNGPSVDQRLLTATRNGADSISVDGLSLANWRTGTYTVTVTNSGGNASNAMVFTVTPGPPVLVSLDRSSATQGQTVTVMLTGTNFAEPDESGNGGSSVHVSALDVGIEDAEVPSTVVSSTEMALVLDTTEAVVTTYAVSVWNPGGDPPPQKSNSLSFTIQP
jgi:hypothetical protein